MTATPCRNELLLNIWRRIDPADTGLRDMVVRAEQEMLEVAERATLDVLALIHHCRLKKAERGIPSGTPCDVCIEDARYFADKALHGD